MADIENNEDMEVTAPMTPDKPELAGEDDQTVKISKPVRPEIKPVASPEGGSDDDMEVGDDMEVAEPLDEDDRRDSEETISMSPEELDIKKDDAEPDKKPQSGEDDQTARIPKSDVNKVVLNSATDSAIRPSDATTMAPAFTGSDLGMRKTESGNVEVLDSISPSVSTASDPGGASMTPPPTATSSSGDNVGRKTIKLKPLKKEAPPPAADDENAEDTLSMDRSALLEGEMDMPGLGGAGAAETKIDDAPTGVNLDDEDTVMIQKPKVTAKPPHPKPSLPGSKETIKLRPSVTPPPPPAGGPVETKAAAAVAEDEIAVAVSKKTIRLVPKAPGMEDDTQKTPKAVGSAKPSAPTVKLQQEPDDVTQKTARPSAPTVKMSEPGGGDSPASSKKTLKLRSMTSASAPPPVAGGDGMPPEGDQPAARTSPGQAPFGAGAADKGADPGIVLTLVAVFALVAIAYYAWMVGGQWAEQYMEVENANVPGLSGNVK